MGNLSKRPSQLLPGSESYQINLYTLLFPFRLVPRLLHCLFFNKDSLKKIRKLLTVLYRVRPRGQLCLSSVNEDTIIHHAPLTRGVSIA